MQTDPTHDLRLTDDLRHVSITVHGVVQGVGFRPFVFHAATSESLTGWILNETDAVRIEVQGPDAAVGRFLETLRQRHPPAAVIESLEIRSVSLAPGDPQFGAFEIRESTSEGPPRPVIPADIATCAECLAEILDPQVRRYRYPFTNCTNCGPRWSIVDKLPYDRPHTSMHAFAMCPRCRSEYEAANDRRFHAQPIACPDCGPQLTLISNVGDALAHKDEALNLCIGAILQGSIVAIKGLGGFQLVADATSSPSVRRLRHAKQRPDKPFAVMLPDLREVRRRCCLSDQESAELVSPRAPILLLKQRADEGAVRDIVDEVAPGSPWLGVMLPYTPLHHLLIRGVHRPLVCTSGNLSEEPMAIDTKEAVGRLGAIADLILTHDRPISRPVDDSVARVGCAGLQLLRRARGYAPLPLTFDEELPTILAVGGHLKNAVALSLGHHVVASSHIGDLDNSLAIDLHRRAIADLLAFYEVKPDVVACDAHPDYASTQYAARLSAQWNIPLVQVQHHHAHIAACVAETGIQGPVLGFAWDGAGYGPDGTVWGGEALLCDGSEFRRVSRLRSFPLPGGDRARASHVDRRSACCSKSSANTPGIAPSNGLLGNSCRR